jgi:hypothetical protein
MLRVRVGRRVGASSYDTMLRHGDDDDDCRRVLLLLSGPLRVSIFTSKLHVASIIIILKNRVTS